MANETSENILQQSIITIRTIHRGLVLVCGVLILLSIYSLAGQKFNAAEKALEQLVDIPFEQWEDERANHFYDSLQPYEQLIINTSIATLKNNGVFINLINEPRLTLRQSKHSKLSTFNIEQLLFDQGTLGQRITFSKPNYNMIRSDIESIILDKGPSTPQKGENLIWLDLVAVVTNETEIKLKATFINKAKKETKYIFNIYGTQTLDGSGMTDWLKQGAIQLEKEGHRQVIYAENKEGEKELFPDLWPVFSEIRTMTPNGALMYIRKLKGNDQEVSVFGLELRKDFGGIIAPILIILTILYLRAHLSNLKNQYMRIGQSIPGVPWIGLMNNAHAIALNIFSIIILPNTAGALHFYMALPFDPSYFKYLSLLINILLFTVCTELYFAQIKLSKNWNRS